MRHHLLFFFYTLGIHAGNLFIFLGSFFSPKLKLLYIGRKATISELQKNENEFTHPIWVHCASLGEFEQGRPVIEAIKSSYPERKVILSFFSPSGYEIRKHYHGADHILYLPSDLPKNDSALVKHFKPDIFIFVKYEFWWSLIVSLLHNGCKVYLISGVFRQGDYFFNAIFKPFKSLLARFECIFVQDEQSAEILTKHGIYNHQIAGDTRIDRVIANAKSIDVPEKILRFTDGHPTIVYGSVWMSDMSVVKETVLHYPNCKHIIAPHEISISTIREISEFLQQETDLFSDEEWHSNILIINNIGLLNRLYAIAKYAYVGGGFKKGIHNILEPAVFGIPVFFGPNHSKFNEAHDLLSCKGAFVVHSPSEMLTYIDMIESEQTLITEIKENSQKYFEINKGATGKIIGHLAQNL